MDIQRYPEIRRNLPVSNGMRFCCWCGWFVILCFCLWCFTPLAAQNDIWKKELKLAIRSNDVTKVTVIFSSNSLPPSVTLDDNLMTPLHLASITGSREVAAWLIGQGAPVDAATAEQGHTPLIIAAGRGQAEV